MGKGLVERAKEHGVGPTGTCAICGGNYIWHGNNPFPVVKDKDARCCSYCNDTVVIPVRFKEIVRQHKEDQK